jgi:hypothetical protein
MATANRSCSFDLSSRSPSRDAHLTKSQVRKLWDAGSFLVQEYGIVLNTRIVIYHKRLGISETREGTQLVSALVHELGMALKRSAPRSCPHFHWLYAHQLGWKTGFSTTLVAHIPEALVDEAHEHLFDRFLAKRYGWPLPKNTVLLRTTRYENRTWRFRRHLQLMRMLCRSVDPNIKVRDRGERRALIDVLSIPKRLRETFDSFEVPQRCRSSKTIGEKIQNKAVGDRLAPLSAFGDQAWTDLFTRWELDEYDDRQREKEDREKARLRHAIAVARSRRQSSEQVAGHQGDRRCCHRGQGRGARCAFGPAGPAAAHANATKRSARRRRAAAPAAERARGAPSGRVPPPNRGGTRIS